MKKRTIDQRIKETDQRIQRLRDQQARLTVSVLPQLEHGIDRLLALRGKLAYRKKLAEAPPEIRKLLKIKDGEKRFATSVISLLREKISQEQFEELHKGALITAKWFSLPIWMIVMLSKKVGWIEEEMRKMRYAKHRGKSKELRHLDEMEKAIRESA
jgi:hypothetical protein